MQGNETNYAVLATRWEDLWTHPLVSSTWLVAVLGPESPIPLPLCGWYLGDHLFPYDSDACLKLCADGFWIYKDSHDSAFRFSDFLASLDLVELKTRFPQGTCARSGPDILYQTGRYRRFGNRLELSSWDEQEGREFVWLTLSIVSPGRMVSGPNRDNWEFIPDPAAEPGRGT